MKVSTKRLFKRWGKLSVFVLVFLIPLLNLADVAKNLEKIKLPENFQIRLFATGVKNARSMVLSPKGILFVGTRKAGNVYAIVDKDQDYQADKIYTIASGLNMPNGVAFKNGSLYIAEVNRVLRWDTIETQLNNPPKPVVVNDKLPSDRHHGWKFIAIGPDGYLYVPVGAPCNVCLKENPIYATIMRMKLNGSGLEVFASGVRNTVGFDWHPITRQLWFTDNGRDWLGDNLPPDELNHAPEKGYHFGFPFIHGKNIMDKKFGKNGIPKGFKPPQLELPAHVASLGMRFYTGKMFPPYYKNSIFIAEHGSWNRKTPIGYRLTVVTLDGNRVTSYTPFAEGWIDGRWGRPVDVLIMPDGSLLVSDDRADAIYRITYKKPKQP